MWTFAPAAFSFPRCYGAVSKSQRSMQIRFFSFPFWNLKKSYPARGFWLFSLPAGMPRAWFLAVLTLGICRMAKGLKPRAEGTLHKPASRRSRNPRAFRGGLPK